MALAGPSIKGTVSQAIVDDLRALVARKTVSRRTLEARLHAADLRILDSKIDGARWYPMGSYGRMLELLRDVEGRSDPRGRARAHVRRATLSAPASSRRSIGPIG